MIPANDNVTVRAFWEQRVDTNPDAPFLVYGQERFSYGEFDASVNRVANGLLAEGVGQGDKVAILLPSDIRLLRLQLAIQKIGAVMVPMIPTLTHGEITYVLRHCEPSVLVTDNRGYGVIADGGGFSIDHKMRAFSFGGGFRQAGGDGQPLDAAVLESEDEGRPPALGIDPADPMAIMYTSGSTGKPKGVVQPSNGFVAAGRAIADRLGATEADNFFSCLPLFHAAATHMLLSPAIAVGARFTLEPTFSRSAFWEQVNRSGGTITLMMPAQLSILMTAPAREDDRAHSMRIVFSHIRPEDFCERFGVEVCTTWAMTETCGLGTLTAPHEGDLAPKLIGGPLGSGEIKIVDGNGDRVAAGELGELCFRHPYVMREYYNDPDNTARTLQDGWVHSGDLCAMDERGRAYFHGRIKHIIKRAGENIAGEEVEFAIAAHPAVEECITSGVEDPIYTEEVHATVRVGEGHDLTEQGIIEWCSTLLADWKIPRYISLADAELPKLANGKTDRQTINRNLDVSRAWDRSKHMGKATS
ncbi:class I adenylate-forming enzyme family protein [Blastococcus tunisiensis]|uniref:Crotonobetaine/carnitine-CoA ligase n=1 Tax=Blastococcus tunisiensis TaxID=1798228 RepID=A0A1I2A7G5_9ACTN|nr:class I adenylate-forming enzyme family protein [Blastococcus sp. DSM 46838]SFE39717.1 crotonobetaine/carnitine-CoA ligase [Blastococcus sp. DSM 46838]